MQTRARLHRRLALPTQAVALLRSGVGWPLAALLSAPHALAAQSFRLVLLEEGAASGCVDQAELERGVAERLGYQPFESAASSTILVRVASRDAALTGTMSASG